jgi:hypothetical protein
VRGRGAAGPGVGLQGRQGRRSGVEWSGVRQWVGPPNHPRPPVTAPNRPNRPPTASQPTNRPQPDYKDAEALFPDFRKQFGPRGVIHSYADGRIEDTGPLTRKRMEARAAPGVEGRSRDAGARAGALGALGRCPACRRRCSGPV